MRCTNCVPSITDEDNEPVTLPEPGNVAPVPALSLSHASFSLAPARPMLNDVTLELPLGKTLGVVGGTGDGKSTLVWLIPRLYDANAGSVSVMGADVAPGRSISCAMWSRLSHNARRSSLGAAAAT